jgi:hypothetical protein
VNIVCDWPFDTGKSFLLYPYLSYANKTFSIFGQQIEPDPVKAGILHAAQNNLEHFSLIALTGQGRAGFQQAFEDLLLTLQLPILSGLTE